MASSARIELTRHGKVVIKSKSRGAVIRKDLVETYGYSEKRADILVRQYHPDAKIILQLNHPEEYEKHKREDTLNAFYTDWIDELTDIIVECDNLPHMSHSGVALPQPQVVGFI